MATKTFVCIQASDAVLDYTVLWDLLVGTDDHVVVSTWEVPSPLIQPFVDSFTGTSTTVWITGGVDAGEYTVTNHILTAAGREDDARLIFKIKDDV